MPATFRNFSLDLTTTLQTAYTCPLTSPTGPNGGLVQVKNALLFFCQAANISDGTTDGDVTWQWIDVSSSNKATRLGKLISIPSSSALGLLSGAFSLDPGDYIQFVSSASSLIQISGTVVEMT